MNPLFNPLVPPDYAHIPVPSTGQNIPAFWKIPSAPLVFRPGTGNVVREASWQSPIMDLYPWFKGSMGEYPLDVLSIWRAPGGAGGQLFLWLRGFDSEATSKNGIRVLTRESGHPTDTTLVQPFLEQEDHTLSIGLTVPASLINLQAPGGGYPMRYWRVTLVVQYTVNNPADPGLWVEGGYY